MSTSTTARLGWIDGIAHLSGKQVIDLIDGMQSSHDVDTVVEGQSMCASMCVPIYLAGQKRLAQQGARFMFHEVRFDRRDPAYIEATRELKRLNIPPHMISMLEQASIKSGTDELFEKQMNYYNVDQRWLAKIRERIKGRDVWLTADELVAQKSGVVQQLH